MNDDLVNSRNRTDVLRTTNRGISERAIEIGRIGIENSAHAKKLIAERAVSGLGHDYDFSAELNVEKFGGCATDDDFFLFALRVGLCREKFAFFHGFKNLRRAHFTCDV